MRGMWNIEVLGFFFWGVNMCDMVTKGRFIIQVDDLVFGSHDWVVEWFPRPNERNGFQVPFDRTWGSSCTYLENLGIEHTMDHPFGTRGLLGLDQTGATLPRRKTPDARVLETRGASVTALPPPGASSTNAGCLAILEESRLTTAMVRPV